MSLFDPERHEQLQGRAWDADKAKAVVDRIARDTIERAHGEAHWPIHELDEMPRMTEMPKSLYLGAAGVIWALDYLKSVGATDIGADWSSAIQSLEAEKIPPGPNWTASPHSYLFGDSSILLMKWKSARSPAVADALAEAVSENETDETRELMWSSPGTMLAALFMYEWTGEDRWADLFRSSAKILWQSLEESEDPPCRLWKQKLYGREFQFLGAVHGFSSNVFPIIKGFALLPESDRAAWQREIVTTLTNTARIENGLRNWPPVVGRDGVQDFLVQHCHGAPGVVVCTAGLPGDVGEEFETCLLEGGELVWAVGPLTKGSNLCHGTGGNGYAFLKLFERTGDELWLSRARSFAMHAIDQFDVASKEYGQLRYSLWTGDPGFACYLWDCIEAKARFPTMDVF